MLLLNPKKNKNVYLMKTNAGNVFLKQWEKGIANAKR